MANLLLPNFKRFTQRDGSITVKLGYTDEAKTLQRFRNTSRNPIQHSALPSVVRQQAVEAVRKLGGDCTNEQHILGQYQLQFGVFHGKTFLWVVNNALGYGGYIIDKVNVDGERESGAALSKNKFAFKKYLESFSEGVQAVSIKKGDREKVVASQRATSAVRAVNVRPGPNVRVPNVRQAIRPNINVARHPPTSTATGPTATTSSHLDAPPHIPAPPISFDLTDEELLAAVEPLLLPASQDYPLANSWRKGLPEIDHRWISKALFKWSTAGKPELAFERAQHLMWHPPEPQLSGQSPPKLDRYYGERLFIWMPKKLWKYRLVCANTSCNNHELTSAGLYPGVRRVLDVDCMYNMVTEYLECSHCKRKVIAWSASVLSQLDVGHRNQFPAIMTYRYACDLRVIRLLRDRGLGNGPSRLYKTIMEQHNERYLQKSLAYLTQCKAFADASSSGLVNRPSLSEPPPMPTVPKFRWLLTVYCQDVLQRIDEVKASITCVFGRILKMDSTRKVAKKLSGHATKTAEWMTNVGNEHGQVLVSVMTAKEGSGLLKMTNGIVQRYDSAEMDPPLLIYVDRDCCSGKTKDLFAAWPDLMVRLDIYHFMRRIATGCSTESHQLHKMFMSRLSQCIFQWDNQDVELLKLAKKNEMVKLGLTPDDNGIIRNISSRELALHCRRTTRDPEEIRQLIHQLIQTLDGEQGRDTLGVPLFNHKRVWEEWDKAAVHVHCISDPPGLQLYTELGSLTKGGVELKKYRCARGSTSLESFHLHINRFIPGSTASDVHFQAYLLEGLMRWNQDRERAAMSTVDKLEPPQSYSVLLRHAANKLSKEVFGKTLVSNFKEPSKYTGELLGVEYLYDQTGKVLQVIPDKSEGGLEQDGGDDDDDEGFEDLLSLAEDPTITTLYEIGREQNQPLDSPPSHFVRSPPEESLQSSLPDSPPSHSIPSPPEESVQSSLHDSQQCSSTSHETATQSIAIPLSDSQQPASSQDHATPSSLTGSLESSIRDPHPSSSITTSDSSRECVGPDNVPGYGKVHALAAYLVGLRDQERPLDNGQADTITQLWSALSEFDRRSTIFQPRFSTQSPRGRFKAAKSSVAPGVEATRRCFLGQNAGPAQRPDANRYMEAMFEKLCNVYPVNTVLDGVRASRWSLIQKAYQNIRSLVLHCATVTTNTGIQLADINQATLTHWFNRKSKEMERTVLEQGISLPAPRMTSETPLPAALQLQENLPSGSSEQHQFTLPTNAAGAAKQSRRSRPIAPRQVVFAYPTPPGLLVQNRGDVSLSVAPQATSVEPQLPSSTMSYRRKRVQQEAKGEVKRQRYNRKTGTICGQCAKERLAPSHRQYYGSWWCEEKSPQTYEEWVGEQKRKKGEKSKTS